MLSEAAAAQHRLEQRRVLLLERRQPRLLLLLPNVATATTKPTATAAVDGPGYRCRCMRALPRSVAVVAGIGRREECEVEVHQSHEFLSVEAIVVRAPLKSANRSPKVSRCSDGPCTSDDASPSTPSAVSLPPLPLPLPLPLL